MGPFYEWDHDWITCDGCAQLIGLNKLRYKSRFQPNLDLCQNCLINKKENPDSFFKLKNNMNEMVFHEFITCKNYKNQNKCKFIYFLLLGDGCSCSPLWGLRFACCECISYSLCEGNLN